MITIHTKKPVAVDSWDHIEPYGTKNDNSINPAFNKRLYGLIPAKEVRLLDLGCAGGGLVKSIIDDGGFAVGIEGSDYNLVNQRAEWKTIPGNLFTADCTEPFDIRTKLAIPGTNGVSHCGNFFNVITAWEFFEHIAENKISAVCDNIRHHMAWKGFFIGSIMPAPDRNYHQTVHGKAWWIELFQSLELEHVPSIEKHFEGAAVRTEGFLIALRCR
jgi:cyclopropane fatty-acyl-phospholipid synthase-like methyltransferase